MASTRNRNTPGNYCLEQRKHSDISQWNLYENGASGKATSTKWAGNGLNPGQLPWDSLSGNPADIESFLWGINSTNLVQRAPDLKPELKKLESAHVFQKSPIIMPVPQAVAKHQRPNLS
jgi:hypothetical protein